MASFSKKLYFLKRFGNSLFTYSCASCGKAVRGKCLCDECSKKLISSEIQGKDFSFAYYYEGPARDTLLRYKFHGDYEYCTDTLCDWLVKGYSRFSASVPDAVVPVPSYKRKSTRLTELAKNFCLMTDLPFMPELLVKTRKTQRQHDISYAERLTNLKDAFEADDFVCGKTVLLIDDIHTTGATVSECSKALFEKGAKKVLVLTLFKTEKQ